MVHVMLFHAEETYQFVDERSSVESDLVTAQSTAYAPPEDGLMGRPKYGKTLAKYGGCMFVFTQLLILHLWTLMHYITSNLLIYEGR